MSRERRILEIHLDCTFMSRREEGDTLTLIDFRWTVWEDASREEDRHSSAAGSVADSDFWLGAGFIKRSRQATALR